MPTFSLLCRQCNHAYEEFRWPSEGMPACCPSCQEPFGAGFDQNWMENRPIGRCGGEDRITTVGQQAEYNARRLGREQMGMLAQADRRRMKGGGFTGKLPEGAQVVAKPDDAGTEQVPSIERINEGHVEKIGFRELSTKGVQP